MDEYGRARGGASRPTSARRRDAANREDFFFRCENRSFGRRARTAVGRRGGSTVVPAGATADLDPARRALSLIVDNRRAASNRVRRGATTEPEGALSVDMGCVAHHRTRAAPRSARTPKEFEHRRCRSSTRTSTTSIVRVARRRASAGTFVGLAGTITTVAAVEIGPRRVRPARRIHHFRLTRARGPRDVFPHASPPSRTMIGSRTPGTRVGSGPT